MLNFHKNMYQCITEIMISGYRDFLPQKSHSQCNFVLNWAGKGTHITKINKSANRSKYIVNSTSLLFNLSDWWWKQIVNSGFNFSFFFFKYDCHIREMKTQQNKLYKGKVE